MNQTNSTVQNRRKTDRNTRNTPVNYPFFELNVKVLKGTVNLNTVIDELSRLRIVLDDQIEQSSHEMYRCTTKRE